MQNCWWIELKIHVRWRMALEWVRLPFCIDIRCRWKFCPCRVSLHRELCGNYCQWWMEFYAWVNQQINKLYECITTFCRLLFSDEASSTSLGDVNNPNYGQRKNLTGYKTASDKKEWRRIVIGLHFFEATLLFVRTWHVIFYPPNSKVYLQTYEQVVIRGVSIADRYRHVCQQMKQTWWSYALAFSFSGLQAS
jgi:hypothetical protein